MTPHRKHLTWQRRILWSILPLILLISFTEGLLRCIYYHRRARYPMAVLEAWQSVKGRVFAERVKARKGQIRITYDDAWDQLFKSSDARVLEQARARYSSFFSNFLAATQQAQTQLIVLYLPSTEPGTDKHVSEAANREFYKQLTQQFQVPFFDLTDQLRQYEWRDITLLPQDGHLSRFGNRIVARQLDQILQSYSAVRTPAKMLREDQIYGDLPPNLDEVMQYDRYQPFRLITNRQGFRNLNSVTIDRSRQRVLAIGDSFTYGLHIDNHETWPAILEQLNPAREIINAGIPGHTITHELDLFQNRARLVAPDITILQVLDNDLLGVHLNE